MKRTLPAAAVLLLASLSITHRAAAQQPAAGGRPPAPAAAPRTAPGRLTGTVTDAATGKPVSYATVAVLDGATGKAVTGSVCGDDGRFVLPVPAGTYTVQVSFVGYKNEERPGVVVPDGSPVALGSIALAAAAQKLGEVVVTAQKPLIEERVDRTVYNAENDQTARGGDASDVLRRVPLLSVDLDGNVSLRGSQNIRVLINNKPSAIAASSVADALRQIPADQVKTVEVITSPSAKYDAEGTGGIINIITKTNTLRGGTLSLDTSVGTRSANLSLTGSYRTASMGFSLGGFGRTAYNIPGEFSNEQTVKDAGGAVRSATTQTADTRQARTFGRPILGWDYDLDPHNALTASLSYGVRNARTDQDRLTTLTSSAQGNSVRDVRIVDQSGTVDASLTYTHLFEKPQHEFSLLTLFSRNDRTNDFRNTLLDATDFRTTGRLLNENPSANEEFTVQADYQAPVGTGQLLELGGKNIRRRVSSDFRYFRAVGDGPLAPLPGAALTNGLNYRQNVTAGYASYTLGLPKGFTLKPGLRYEYTTIAADFADGTALAIPDYGVLVPSVNFSRKLANGNVAKAAYNRRIQRPSLQFLNPNIQAANPLITTQGNPGLEPEYTNNYELGYSTLVKRANVSFSAFVRNTTGAIQAVRTPRTDGIQEITYANIGEENAYGGSVFASLNGKRLSLNGGVDAYYAVLRNNAPNPLFSARNEGLVASARLFGSYKLTELWTAQAFSFVRPRLVQLQGYQGGFGFYALSFRRDFANKKGSFGFGAENFLTPTIRIRTQVNTPLLDQTSTATQRALSLTLNLSYRIGKLTADQRPRRSRSINNDDLKSGGDEGGGGGGGAAPAGGGPAGGGRPAAPAGAPGARPGGPPAGAPGSPSGASGTLPAPAPPGARPDSTARPVSGRPAGFPGAPPVPAAPADTTGRRPATSAPLPTPPANAPAPGTATPGGIAPAGSPGGRP